MAASPAPSPSALAPPPRLLSLDAFRGLTIAAMILVNNPGSWNAVYWPLDHAHWHGWTPTDLVFPFFLFMVGMALPTRASTSRPCASRECSSASRSATWPRGPYAGRSACAARLLP
jgi:predicted acyltransferase